MKYCKRCGNPLDPNAIFCPKCGARANGDDPQMNYNPYGGFGNPYGNFGGYPVYDTRGSVWVTVLSFAFWQIGLLMWFFWRHTRPGKARSAAKGALSYASAGMPILGLVLWLVWKNTPENKDLAKVCGISAIVGAAVYALLIVCVIVLNVTGASDALPDVVLPFSEMAFALLI